MISSIESGSCSGAASNRTRATVGHVLADSSEADRHAGRADRGCARACTMRTSWSGRTIRYSSSNGRSDATEPSIALRTRSRSSGWIRLRWASNVPSKSSGSTAWMRWNSSLHCTVPVRRSQSQLPTWASASPSRTARLGFGQRRLREPLLGDVARDEDRRDGRAAFEHGRQRQRDRHRHAVLAQDLGFAVADPAARHHRLEDLLHTVTHMRREENRRRHADHLMRGDSRTTARRSGSKW